MSAQWLNSRQLAERIIVTGKLRLETPAHFGNGDGEGLLDMPLHLDTYDGRALLTGASLAGALRSYIARYSEKQAQALFGDVYDDPTGQNAVRKRSEESLVIVDDAFGDRRPLVELRDGVAIDPRKRTAEDRKKYDMQLLAAGTEFSLTFELLVRNKKDKTSSRTQEEKEELIQLFALALQGLAQGHIRLGKRKRRGFGQCQVDFWTVHRYNMQNTEGMIAWLQHKADAGGTSGADLFALLGVQAIAQVTPRFRLDATFRLDSSLLIRSTPGADDKADATHLQAKRKGRKSQQTATHNRAVVSGTSATGALRARSLRIVNTLASEAATQAAQPDENAAARFVDTLFGYRAKDDNDKTPLWASRLWVDETYLQAPLLVHTRVKIDRFTGGSYPGALFSNAPIWAGEETRVQIRLVLDTTITPPSVPQPDGEAANLYTPAEDAEIGLLLLLLKDLWTGDLPLGGESSVGRGRLIGESATIEIGDETWTLTATTQGTMDFNGADPTPLENYVNTFVQHVQGQLPPPTTDRGSA